MQPTRKLTDFRIKLSTGWHWVIVDRLDGFSFDGGSRREKLIVVNPDTAPSNFLDSTVHEVLHRALPNATEATVARVANDVSKVVWKMGWRLP